MANNKRKESGQGNRKIAVLFPGIGYTCDKPLLYYTAKIAAEQGYEIVKVNYSGFEAGIKGDEQKMQAAFRSALSQAETILEDIVWSDYDQILFISKSVETVVSSCYTREHALAVKNILLTPLTQTFLFAGGNCVAFHGTSDPWAKTEDILKVCQEKQIPVFLTEGGNHSLEVGNVETDVKNLREVLREICMSITPEARQNGKGYK